MRLHQVEVLAGGDLDPHEGEPLEGGQYAVGREGGAVEEMVRPHEGEVAGQDGGGGAEVGRSWPPSELGRHLAEGHPRRRP